MNTELERAAHQARIALRGAPQVCRFHGLDFEFLGFAYGEPRCESCRQPWRVMEALKALDAALG